MTIRACAAIFIVLVSLAAVRLDAQDTGATRTTDPAGKTLQSGVESAAPQAAKAPEPDPASRVDYWAPPAEEAPLCPPDDPCLPRLYKDWREFAEDNRSSQREGGFIGARITIDRANFILTLEGIARDGREDAVYRTHVGLGDFNTPTPAGRFIINHLYCYPDVVFFTVDSQQIPFLYKGFFAPILKCDRTGHCRRYRELGIHGFDASALPNLPKDARVIRYGAVSNGCIRVPDPCRLKKELIRLVGIGALRKNERGCYHWLKRPVEVVIEGDYPGTQDDEPLTLVSIFEQGVSQVQNGLKDLISVFGP